MSAGAVGRRVTMERVCCTEQQRVSNALRLPKIQQMLERAEVLFARDRNLCRLGDMSCSCGELGCTYAME